MRGHAGARGARQGPAGGPVEWVVFMNFWLEHVHNAAKGGDARWVHGGTTEATGQMPMGGSN